MNETALALLGYAAWTLLLLGLIAGQRAVLTLSGKRAANSFSTSGEDLGPFAIRLVRAHANTYEFFPVVGGILAVALATESTHLTNPLALWLLAARVAQTTVHLISTSEMAVVVRFAALGAQMAIAISWLLRLAWPVLVG